MSDSIPAAEDFFKGSYEGRPDFHHKNKHQSPVAIVKKAVLTLPFPRLQFINYHTRSKFYIANTEKTISLCVKSKKIPTVKLGNRRFQLHDIHFHWPSEHTIHGIRWPLALHLVHFAKKYGTVENAVNKKDGVLVLAIMIEIAPHQGNEIFETLEEVIKNVAKKPNVPFLIKKKLHMASFLPSNTRSFYVYHGSSTTHAYQESIIWVILEKTLFIRTSQLKAIKDIYTADGKLVIANNRSLQPLNERRIYYRTAF